MEGATRGVVVAAAAAAAGGGEGGGSKEREQRQQQQRRKQGDTAAAAAAAEAHVAEELPGGVSPAVTASEEDEGSVDPEAERLAMAASLLLASNGRHHAVAAAAGANGAAAAVTDGDADGPAVTAADDEGTDYESDDDPVMDALSLPEEAEVGPEELSVAVGILRQTGADEGLEVGQGAGLSHRVLQLLELVEKWPGRGATALTNTSSSSSSSQSGASGPGAGVGVAGGDGGVGVPEGASVTDSFWEEEWVDEWSDVRAALMSVGVEAGVVDSMEEEDVSKWEEGEREATRPRLLRMLPKFDAEGAKKLGEVLQELRKQRVEELGAQNQQQLSGSGRGGVGGSDVGHSVQSVMAGETEEEAEWWQEVAVAYQALWVEAQAVEREQLEQRAGGVTGEGVGA